MSSLLAKKLARLFFTSHKTRPWRIGGTYEMASGLLPPHPRHPQSFVLGMRTLEFVHLMSSEEGETAPMYVVAQADSGVVLTIDGQPADKVWQIVKPREKKQ